MNRRQKKKQLKMKNKKLINEFPFLLPRNVWTDKVPADYDYTYTEYDCIDKGWQIGFGKFLLQDLKEACEKTGYTDRLRFTQVKEKYGTLRIYTNGAPEEVHDVIRKYEFLSGHICIHCGSPFASVVDDYGWYLPTCKHCWEKFNKKREQQGLRIMSYEEAGGEDNPALPESYTLCIYSHGEEKKVIYDISDTTEKILKTWEKRCKR